MVTEMAYDDSEYGTPKQWAGITGVVFLALLLILLLILSCIVGFGAVGRWNRERNIATERQDITITAQAEAEAQEARTISEVEQAERLAERDRIRAEGLADANAVINDSLTPEFLQYYWIEGVRESDAQLIYVPVDPGTGIPSLPVTEAGRATTPTTQGQGQ
jgi:hypothetical protein